MTTMPAGRPTFTEDWFLWFAPQLELPEGAPFRLEGHTRLMTREFFAPPLVNLLVVIPKNNLKTTWEAALAVWHLLTVKAPRVYAGAADLEQAKELYGFAAHFVESNADLAARLDVRESTREIRTSAGRGLFKTLASDDSKGGGKKQGKNFTLGELDELHAHANGNLWTDFRSAGFKRREAARIAGDPLWWTIGKLASITTAGYDKDSVLWGELVKFLGDPEFGILPMGTVETGLRVLDDGSVVKDPERGRLTIARYGEGRNVLLHWACNPDDDPDDFEVTKWANPASTATIESLKDAREALTPWTYDRYRRNLWTLSFESWIPADAWSNLRDERVAKLTPRTWEDATTSGAVDDDGRPLLRDVLDEDGNVKVAALTEEFSAHLDALYPPGTEIVAAVDMARYRDTCAVVCLGLVDGLLVPRALVWRTGGPDNPIRYEWPKAACIALHERYQLRACGYDEKYFDQAAEELTAAGLEMEKRPQSNERMAPAADDLRMAILTDKAFSHDGDPVLAAHVMAAQAKDINVNEFKLVKSGANGPPIDACIALAMAFQLWTETDTGSMYDDDEVGI